MPLNANAIIDVATVKAMVKLSGVADDTIIENYINGASTFFENYCAQKFVNQALTEVYDGLGEDKLILEYSPISALTEVKLDFDTLTPTVVALTDFNYNAKAGILHYMEGTFPEGFQNIQVKYTSGYGAAIANLPDDLKMAAALQVEFYYKRDTADFSTTFEEGFILKAEPKSFAPRVKDLLDPYKKVVL